MKTLTKLLKKMQKQAETTKKDVPIVAAIISNNKIISLAKNKKIQNQMCFHHAECLAIQKASKKMHTWNLNKCDLYVSLEPCSMCKEIIQEARIKNVFYFNKSNYNNYKKTNYIYLKNKLFLENIKIFFKHIRNKRTNVR